MFILKISQIFKILNFEFAGICNRPLENCIKKGGEGDSRPNVRKNSADCTTLELFVQALYEKIVNINNLKIYSMIKSYYAL